ncbi:MAG: hypothetical protein LWX83_02130 [Anaerolineae bacterium]|nr:hypothetical protein [Anaerolineae bacterium]
MNELNESFNRAEAHISDVVNKLLRQWSQVVHNPATRRLMFNIVEQSILDNLDFTRKSSKKNPGLNDEHTALNLCLLKTAERTLLDYEFSDSTLQGLLGILIRDQLVNKKTRKEKERAFMRVYGQAQPSFLMINPVQPVYSAEGGQKYACLDWPKLERVVAEAENLWGACLVLLVGDDLLLYRSQDKDLFDLAKKHPAVFFVLVVNGKDLTDETCARLKQCGNISPVLIINPPVESVDNRLAMQRLYGNAIPFGVLLITTRDFAENLLSTASIDFIFGAGHALYGLVSPVPLNGMPPEMNAIPGPPQRLWIWRRSQDLMRSQGILLIDFWNYGTLTGGCLAGGGCGYGGYFYINWKGDISPCVLMPYAAANLNQVFESGGCINDIWALPFFKSIRQWQKTQGKDNLLTPCLFWDHQADLNQILENESVYCMNEDFAPVLQGSSYRTFLDEYSRIFSSLVESTWKEYYQGGH